MGMKTEEQRLEEDFSLTILFGLYSLNQINTLNFKTADVLKLPSMTIMGSCQKQNKKQKTSLLLA